MDSITSAVAITPAVILMIVIYRADKLEKESLGLLLRIIIFGALAIPVAIALETVGESFVLPVLFRENSLSWMLFDNFIVVAVSEEFSKYIFMKRITWKSHEFNCQFDAVVYCVIASLSFALIENLGYVGMMGLSVGLMRAVTAVPGHACFGAIMGIYYGRAKRFESEGHTGKAASLRKAAVIIPALWHGAYDFLATAGSAAVAGFFGLVVVMYIYTIALVRKAAKNDSYFVGTGGAEDISYYLFNNKR